MKNTIDLKQEKAIKDMDEIIDLYLKGEYNIPKVEFIPDNEYYFYNKKYFNVKSSLERK
jgi:hypothetical protein